MISRGSGLGVVAVVFRTIGLGDEDEERERLLDAARVEFVAHGFRRAAVADIAKRANVSRQTLNRRCGDKDDMVSAVVGREVLQFFVTLAPLLDPEDNVEDQVVELFVTGMRECRVNPVVAALKEYETESMSVGLFATEHGNYQAVLTLLAMRLMGMVIPKRAPSRPPSSSCGSPGLCCWRRRRFFVSRRTMRPGVLPLLTSYPS